MCGRFTLRTPSETIASMFDGLEVPEIEPNYNVAPTHVIPAVRQVEGKTVFARLQWGLIPFWADDKKIGSRMINARGESVRDKPSFRDAFKKRRCLILADGFYEWQKTSTGKQPIYVHTRNDAPFCFAGLWERNSKINGTIESCTIITTDANPLMANFHDRMPVILHSDQYDTWLDAEFQDHDYLSGMLVPDTRHELVADLVSRNVNRVSYNQPDCIASIGTPEVA